MGSGGQREGRDGARPGSVLSTQYSVLSTDCRHSVGAPPVFWPAPPLVPPPVFWPPPALPFSPPGPPGPPPGRIPPPGRPEFSSPGSRVLTPSPSRTFGLRITSSPSVSPSL